MTTITTSLRILYTAPTSPDIGQQTASVVLDGPPLAIAAVCETELIVQHPAGQRLRLMHPDLRVDDTSEALAVLLPSGELQLDLDVVAEPSETTAKIKVTTKKESSKPDPTRRAVFRP